MKKHANEPWRVSNNEFDGNAILGADGNEICWAYHEDFGAMLEAIDPENARRIVACVNALAGVPTDHIERFNQSSIKDFSRDLSVRDELLAELKEALRLLEADASNHAMDTIYNAIAKAEKL